jgi:hypothetical protein
MANPGESIVILVKDLDKYWRTYLTNSDKNINPYGINTRVSDNWTDFDHVGASAKYSIPLVSSDCPENHSVQFFANTGFRNIPIGIRRIEIKVTEGQDRQNQVGKNPCRQSFTGEDLRRFNGSHSQS